MNFAVFTPGAYIWPVQRSFEAFLASLAVPAHSAANVLDSPLYPAVTDTETPLTGLSRGMDARLHRLHAELYYAMLRPAWYYAPMSGSMEEYFWGDLVRTPVGELLEAFLFYFTHRIGAGLSISDGLAVLRAVFFNHEAAEPQHWLHSSMQRLAPLRSALAQHRFILSAPPNARLQNMAFVVHAHRDGVPTSPSYIAGVLRRLPNGLLSVEASFGLDPSLDGDPEREAVLHRQEQDAQAVLRRIFGWDGQAEAAA